MGEHLAIVGGRQQTDGQLGICEGRGVGDAAVCLEVATKGRGETVLYHTADTLGVEVEQRIQRLPAERSVDRFVGEDAVQRTPGLGMARVDPHGAKEGNGESLAEAKRVENVVDQLDEGATRVLQVGERGEFDADGVVRASDGHEAVVGEVGVVELVADDSMGDVEQLAR